MQVPNASQVESAVDSLLKFKVDAKLGWMPVDELNEFDCAMGASRLQQLGLRLTTPDENMQVGYLLGLQTARVVIAQSAALILKGVDPKDVL